MRPTPAATCIAWGSCSTRSLRTPSQRPPQHRTLLEPGGTGLGPPRSPARPAVAETPERNLHPVLALDPSRRYVSTGAFALDSERWLNRPSWMSRTIPTVLAVAGVAGVVVAIGVSRLWSYEAAHLGWKRLRKVTLRVARTTWCPDDPWTAQPRQTHLIHLDRILLPFRNPFRPGRL